MPVREPSGEARALLLTGPMVPHSVHPHRRTFPVRGRGFTLVELMVVVIIIGILAFTALPSMSRAKQDRHVYDDAAKIAELLRDARAHALGRGAAVWVSLSTNGHPGAFYAYEAVTANPGGGADRLPVASCKNPTRWVGNGVLASMANQIGFVDFSNSSGYEAANGISTSLVLSDATTATDIQLCFTPGGRTFMVTGATPDFDAARGMTQAFEIKVLTSSNFSGIRRSVIVPPTGIARIKSS